jgi:hypothetical protein
MVTAVAALVCGVKPRRAIDWTAESNNVESDLIFMMFSILASLGTARSTAIELK